MDKQSFRGSLAEGILDPSEPFPILGIREDETLGAHMPQSSLSASRWRQNRSVIFPAEADLQGSVQNGKPSGPNLLATLAGHPGLPSGLCRRQGLEVG
jgi:hypothetical protein